MNMAQHYLQFLTLYRGQVEKWLSGPRNGVSQRSTETPSELVTSPHFASANRAAKRIRLVDKLDVASPPIPPEQTIIRGVERQTSRRGGPASPDSVPQGTIEGDKTQSIASTELQNSLPARRATRSNAFTGRHSDDRLERPVKLKIPFSQTGGLGKEWKKPLVFPKVGKKRETVCFEDLIRLDDDEFLNDSLVGLFMRYLEAKIEELQPEIAKKVYFFNSYFFDSLTQNMKSKSINYQAVQRWTSKVDLFTRDFVVVPVNHNLHWFVAIICNLSYFKRHFEQADEDDYEIVENGNGAKDLPNVQSDQHPPIAERTRESFAEMSLVDNSSSDQRYQGTPPSSTKKGRKRPKNSRRSLPKYQTNKPVIITFDSLGSPRGNIAALLKQYVVQEARDKRSWDIDVADIRAMTAKEIPTQSNFSDCGLYMCMYLEQFVIDPYGFVTRILQRQEQEQGWPRNIRSDELRPRLRNVVLELHREQEGETQVADIPEVGQIMIDKQVVTPQLQPETSSDDVRRLKLEEIKDARVRYQQGDGGLDASAVSEADSPARRQSATVKSSSPAKGNAITTVDAAVDYLRDTIVIDDDSQPLDVARPASSGKLQHNDPKELATILRTRRSPGRPQIYRDRETRADSVSTEYLSGPRSYEGHGNAISGDIVTRVGSSIEVPETQEAEDVVSDGEMLMS